MTDMQARGTSSPRTRGCSRWTATGQRTAPLLPAHAGVFPGRDARGVAGHAPPRARGGVPCCPSVFLGELRSSPRTRGCSRRERDAREHEALLPAHAGVFPWRPAGSSRSTPPPRARGGVPLGIAMPRLRRVSSPRTRGCSLGAVVDDAEVDLLPAHAGVFPCPSGWPTPEATPPRARGGVPSPSTSALSPKPSSPRTRGCSQHRPRRRAEGLLLPAHAGVFPLGIRSELWEKSPPRARGGVPAAANGVCPVQSSSPRTRGV